MCVKLDRLLSPVMKMAALLAAASHDVDHPGVSQTFLTATDNPLASLYTVCMHIAFIRHEGRQYEKIRKTYNGNIHKTTTLLFTLSVLSVGTSWGELLPQCVQLSPSPPKVHRADIIIVSNVFTRT